jgi:ankyrin repeat protein
VPEELTEEELAFLRGVLDLAREGRTAELADAAVFRRSAEAVRLLLDHGADVHAGGRSAAEIAAFFGLDEMAALLAAHGAGGPTAGPA